MKNTEFDQLVKAFRLRQDELIIRKGNDYTVRNAQEDRLWNFKFVAGLVGITPMQALGVYWLKHVLAICTFIKYGKVDSEGVEGRFLDEANYNLLGKALADELMASKTTGSVRGATQSKKMPKVRRAPRGRNKIYQRDHSKQKLLGCKLRGGRL